jgi:putative flippase GtrA
MALLLYKMKKPLFYEIIKFVFVGFFAVIVQYVVYYLCLFIINHNISFAIGYLISFVFNYYLSTVFTFKSKKSFRNGVGFAICHIVNFILQVVLLNLFINLDISKQLAPIPVFAICVPTNFVMVRFVFKKL